MEGMLVLEGGAEFKGEMAEADLKAISLAGGEHISIRILPTAAAVDNNHRQAGLNGVRWFKSLGVEDVAAVEVNDRDGANRSKNAKQIETADLVFILGGSPGYLFQALHGTLCYQSLQHAYSNGKIICGSSAGAMVLCQYFFNPVDKQIYSGLNMLPGCVFVPHHKQFEKTWLAAIRSSLSEATIIGVDEKTAIIGRHKSAVWQVYGRGNVSLYLPDKPRQNFTSGMSMHM